MQAQLSAEQNAVLTQLDAAAAALTDFGQDSERERFRRFLRAYYETAAPDTLRMRPPQALLRTALSHWRLVQRRGDGRPLLRVQPPQIDSDDDAGYASVETCVDDLPFLVDSISLCVHAERTGIDWLVHPVLRLRRDAQGEIVDIGITADSGSPPQRTDGWRSESLIHLEFDALPDAAAYQRLQREIGETLDDVACVVGDFAALRARLREAVVALQSSPLAARVDECAEACEFLNWLDDHHFTFLGYQDNQLVTDGQTRAMQAVPGSALGLLREGRRFAGRELIAPQSELDKYAESPRVIVVTKSTQRSPIQKPVEMDVISVRRFDAQGATCGLSRFIGLFSSEVYIDRPRHIPLIRRKADEVMQRIRLPEHSHAGKRMRDVLHQLPRDELFQCGEDELYRICVGIHALRDHHPLRLFMRRDRYGRFYSCLVYLSRERYSEDLRERLAIELSAVFGNGRIDHDVAVLPGGQTRIHYVVHTPPGTQIELDERTLEARLSTVARSWRDQLRDTLRAVDAALLARFVDAFPLSYAERSSPQEAATDAGFLARLSPSQPLLPRLTLETGPTGSALKLYALNTPIALSDVLPTMKHFGLRALRQALAEISPGDGGALWIQRFEIEAESGELPQSSAQSGLFESAFLAVWRGEVENDGLNRLVLAAGLTARQVALLRAVCKYLIQTGLPYSQAYMIGLLAEHAPISGLLLRLFETRTNPDTATAERAAAEQALIAKLDAALDQVSSLDADRVLRAFLSVIRATLRSNYFQPDADGAAKPWISLKLDPARIPELPLPRPLFETWVYAPQMEGIHLRGGMVARGGLRWSDRAQDFRTEVLGLMKAQMVKNAVIVPVGAKGGFVVKPALNVTDRDAWLAAGQDCYRMFLRGLLDLADNRVGADIQPPPRVLRHDGDDPYLVVAADKGTATFSDIANGVAAEYNFWLGDAFASGGSAGYDHKKMGITARGAWESVKCHFREMGVDIQRQPFTCVGIGDMSGDVFGNGMLLSQQTRLVAAFDHRHIFIDPEPDAASSYVERKRLFVLPRSSWADYDVGLLSPGGGVWPRSAKSIHLDGPARRALGIETETLTPMQLIRAILRAPVDLLWNGGIGTYVKAHQQSNEDVGDRADDALRVDARELRCKVVGEGGNLGFTQAARIEYALHACDGAGGRINTDAIDNAGGVHTSDREVNLKIPLNQLMAEGVLSREQRDPLLAACTDDIARVVLYDNYLQASAISVQLAGARRRLDDHLELMRMLERDGLLNRSLEALPDVDTIRERRAAGLGLTRPELSVLIAYAKISLKQASLASELPDDPFFVHDLLENFPAPLVQRFGDALKGHRLRREIIATLLANATVNRMGPAFVHLQADDHGLSRTEVLKGYATARQVFGGDDYWRAIEAYDYRLPAALQYRLMGYPSGLIKHVTVWFATSAWAHRPIGTAVERFSGAAAEIAALLPQALPPAYREDWQRTVDQLTDEKVPQTLAERLAGTRAMGGVTDIAELAETAAVPLAEAAAIYYLCGERFGMLWLYAAINELPTDGRWQALARVNLRDDAYRIHRQLAGRVMQHPGATPQARLDHWFDVHRDRIERSERRLAEVQSDGNPDFMALAVAVREVRKLRLLS